MSELAVIVVGMDQWEEWTRPAMLSLRKYLPGAKLYLMDAGREAYPKMDGVTTIRMEGSPSYAHNLNEGVRAAWGADWFLMLNNDVLAYEPLDMHQLDPANIYAKRILGENGHEWLELWLALIHKETWRRVGEWDEGFRMCGFDDADYSFRAQEQGIQIAPLTWNIKHFWGKTRWAVPGYKEVREANLDYFERKWGWRPGKNVKVVYE